MIFSKSSCLSILFLELEVQGEIFFLSYKSKSLLLPALPHPAYIPHQLPNGFSLFVFRFKDLIIYVPIITGYIKTVLNVDRM